MSNSNAKSHMKNPTLVAPTMALLICLAHCPLRTDAADFGDSVTTDFSSPSKLAANWIATGDVEVVDGAAVLKPGNRAWDAAEIQTIKSFDIGKTNHVFKVDIHKIATSNPDVITVCWIRLLTLPADVNYWESSKDSVAIMLNHIPAENTAWFKVFVKTAADSGTHPGSGREVLAGSFVALKFPVSVKIKIDGGQFSVDFPDNPIFNTTGTNPVSTAFDPGQWRTPDEMFLRISIQNWDTPTIEKGVLTRVVVTKASP
jgi:hypothetical protein